MVQLFLCYARLDQPKVEQLYKSLSEAMFKPWMDKHDILPGEQWNTAIRKAIRRSDFFLACLSVNSVSRRGVIQKELKQALDIWNEKLEDDIYLIPVRLEECEVPESLSRFQWVDVFEPDGWTKLLKAIQAGVERQSSADLGASQALPQSGLTGASAQSLSELSPPPQSKSLSLHKESNPAAFRQLVVEALSDSDLQTLCFDHFPEVYDRFTSSMTRDAKILQLLDHCKRRDLWGELADGVRELNPVRYRQFESRLWK